MPAAFVAKVSWGGPGSAGGTSGAIDTTGADFIVIAVSNYNNDAQSVSDSASNTWLKRTVYTGVSPHKTRLYYCSSATTSATHTFSVSGANQTYISFCVAAFSGIHATPYDKENGAGAVSPGSITPTNDDSLVISGFETSNSGTAPSVDSSMTLTNGVTWSGGGSGWVGSGLAYKIQTAKAAINPAWGPNNFPVSAIAAFQSAAAAGHPAIKRFGGVPYVALNRGVW